MREEEEGGNKSKNKFDDFTQFDNSEGTYDDSSKYGIFPLSGSRLNFLNQNKFMKNTKNDIFGLNFEQKDEISYENEINRFGILPISNKKEFLAQNYQKNNFFEDLGPGNQKIPSFGILPERENIFKNFEDQKNSFPIYENKNKNKNDNDGSVMMKRWKSSNVRDVESKYNRGGVYARSDNNNNNNEDIQIGREKLKLRLEMEVEKEEKEREIEMKIKEIINSNYTKKNNNSREVVERGSEFLFTLRPTFSLSEDSLSPYYERGRERGREIRSEGGRVNENRGW